MRCSLVRLKQLQQLLPTQPMPVLKTQVHYQIKSDFVARAKAAGRSESELLRLLVLQEIAAEPRTESKVSPDPQNAQIKPMTVRLPAFLHAATVERAAARGMAPSRWIAALVQSNLCQTPVMTERELVVLQESSRELAAIGRNLNQIARAMNTFHALDRVPQAMLSMLTDAVQENRSAIRDLVRASEQAWECE